MDPKEELKSFIISRVHNITHDCRTFLWVRLEHSQNINDDLRVGGGNLLMATGLLAALEYLGNIYMLLVKGAEAKRSPKECGGHLSARASFPHLILNSPRKLGLQALSEVEIKKVWDAWRNGLVHLLVQREGTAVTIYDKDRRFVGRFKEIVAGLENQGDVFSLEGGWWTCHVDKLTSQLDGIADWVAERCDDSDVHVAEALAWVKEN